jgi:tripartite ATP-independent transporter DctP family solute receptor
MREKIYFYLLLCVVSAVWIGCSHSGSTDKIIVRYSHTGVQGETQTRFVQEFSALVSEKTNARVEIQIFPNSQLGNTSEMIDGVKTGIIGMAHHDFALLGKLLPDMSVFNVPYLYKDPHHALKATNPEKSPILQEFNNRLIEKAGIRILGSFYRGARQVTTNFPVYSPSDLKGKKIRGIPLKIWMSMIEGMGAIPTPVEMPEVATALMTGIVSGQENPLSNILSHKLYEVQNYVIMTYHMEAATCVFINEKTWQKIKPDNQVHIRVVLDEMAQKTLDWERLAEQENKAILQSKGMQFIEEKDGLDLVSFKNNVNVRIKEDFPEWTNFINRIRDIR